MGMMPVSTPAARSSSPGMGGLSLPGALEQPDPAGGAAAAGNAAQQQQPGQVQQQQDDVQQQQQLFSGNDSAHRSVAERQQYIQKQQRWLLFLRHCAKCQQDEAECQFSRSCRVGKELWTHILQCNNPHCTYPRCTSSKDLLKHHQKCQVCCGGVPLLLVWPVGGESASRTLLTLPAVNHLGEPLAGLGLIRG